MKDKRKIAWLIIGGLLIAGAIAGNLNKSKQQAVNQSFWGGVEQKAESYSEQVLEGDGDSKIAIIRIDGTITDSAELSTSLLSSSGGVTAEEITSQISQAENDPNVRAVILQINSPGGTAVAGQTILERLAQFKNSGKKLYVAMREVAASAAYEISLPADKIFANQETETGSIGVIMSVPNYSELYGKLGISETVIKSGDKKDIGSASRAMTDEEKSIFQELVNESYNNFVANVAKWRKLDEAKVRQIGDGRIYTAAQAKEKGLIDEIGNMPAVIAAAKSGAGLSEATVVEYQKGLVGGFLSSLLQKVSANTGLSALLGVDNKATTYQLMHMWVQ